MSNTPYITCRELYEFLDDYLDGTLAPAPRHEFERHLRVCPSCVAYLDGYRRTIALSTHSPVSLDQQVSDTAPSGLLDAVRAARKAMK